MPFLDRDEVARSLTGAWRVLLDKPDAAQFFDLSFDGFWRSFRAFVLMIPAYGLAAATEYLGLTGSPSADVSGSAFVLAKAIASLLDWITFPILLALVAEQLGIARRYTSFIVVRNWGAVLASVPFVLIDLLYLLGIFDQDIADVASLVFVLGQLYYSYLIASRTLGAGIGMAVSIVVADFAVSLLIMAITSSVAGLPLQ
jgi:hypothetical protein